MPADHATAGTAGLPALAYRAVTGSQDVRSVDKFRLLNRRTGRLSTDQAILRGKLRSGSGAAHASGAACRAGCFPQPHAHLASDRQAAVGQAKTADGSRLTIAHDMIPASFLVASLACQQVLGGPRLPFAPLPGHGRVAVRRQPWVCPCVADNSSSPAALCTETSGGRPRSLRIVGSS